jgi:hypothetical protein
MTIDLDELSENLYATAYLLTTRCRTAENPLEVVDAVVEDLIKWSTQLAQR